jgi:hypothetical protein
MPFRGRAAALQMSHAAGDLVLCIFASRCHSAPVLLLLLLLLMLMMMMPQCSSAACHAARHHTLLSLASWCCYNCCRPKSCRCAVLVTAHSSQINKSAVAPESERPVAAAVPADSAEAAELDAVGAFEGCRKARKHEAQHDKVHQVGHDHLCKQ